MTNIQLPEYTIFIGSAWQALNQLIQERQYTQIAVLVDQNTKIHCLPTLKAAIDFPIQVLEVSAGEQHKNLATCESIWSQMMQLKLDRKALCINLGGGVIGDMGGFCASTFKRGMDFIQIPTTLLSQVDASIGGKLGIDFMQIKNSIGIFKNPQAVFVNPVFYKSLPAEELRSGMAEVIKHSLIADAPEWKKITQLPKTQTPDWEDLIIPSIQIKRNIVDQDPFEKGIRKSLNFGHTIGHALEGYALDSPHPLLHGEAIAIGMICESYLSYKHSSLSKIQLDEIVDFIQQMYPYWSIPMEQFPAFLELMKNDKKNIQSKINFAFLTQIGAAEVNQTVSDAAIQESLMFYKQLGQ